MDQQKPPVADAPDNAATDRPGGFRGFFLDCLRMLRFFSRLPVPSPAWDPDPHAPPNFAETGALAVPLAGAIIGAISAVVAWIALALGLGPLIAALLAIGTLAAVTGCLHEDGLADCCDGFFSGSTPGRRREIMKDSRLGTFGVVGLVMALALRAATLAEIFRIAGPSGAWLLIGIAALSRLLAFLPAYLVMPASPQGLAGGLGQEALGAPAKALAGLAFGLPLFLAPSLLSLTPAGLAGGAAVGLVLALLATYLLSRLARAKIGGHTGDVLGAAQQLAEISLLLGLAVAAGWQ